MSEPAGGARRVVMATGLSGAGISTLLKTLEDLGFEAVDNLPIALLPQLIAAGGSAGADRPIAFSVDSRTRGFTPESVAALAETLRADPTLDAELVFLEGDDDVLQRRYTETRRRHPLAADRPVSDGIRRERQQLAGLRDSADWVIDSSLLTIHDFRRLVVGRYGVGTSPKMTVVVTSFSFKRGLPREADLVFDVRFLANPHWDPALRSRTGLDDAVQAYVEADPDFPGFMERLTAWLGPLLPRYDREGKSYLTVAVGCTGGKHRSVFIAETLAAWIADRGFNAGVVHRDIPGGPIHRDPG